MPNQPQILTSTQKALLGVERHILAASALLYLDSPDSHEPLRLALRDVIEAFDEEMITAAH